MGLPSISIVTTTYNEGVWVQKFVKSVRESLANIRHEIIIVDDSSPDGTYREALKYADKAFIKPRRGRQRVYSMVYRNLVIL